jgi:hypothetical protein
MNEFLVGQVTLKLTWIKIKVSRGNKCSYNWVIDCFGKLQYLVMMITKTKMGRLDKCSD